MRARAVAEQHCTVQTAPAQRILYAYGEGPYRIVRSTSGNAEVRRRVASALAHGHGRKTSRNGPPRPRNVAALIN